MEIQRLIVGISGASGMLYALRLLEVLCKLKIETHVTITRAAQKTMEYEEVALGKIKQLATYYYDINDMTAPIASGSFRTKGMVVVPCSMKTLAGIARGYSQNLLLRAADVTIKEGRKLVIVPRETPLSIIHLKNMLAAAISGAIILPAMPAFYHKPKTIDDLINQVTGKILDLFNIEHDLYKRWGEKKQSRLPS